MLHHTSSLKKQWFQIGASAVIWVIHMFVYHDIIVKYIFNLALVFIYFSSNVFTFISILLFKYFLTYVLCHLELFRLFTSFTMLFSTISFNPSRLVFSPPALPVLVIVVYVVVAYAGLGWDFFQDEASGTLQAIYGDVHGNGDM